MADTVTVFNGNTGGTNYSVASDEVQVGGTMALSHVQYVKLVDGSLDGTVPIQGNSSGSLAVVPRQDVQQITLAVPGLTLVSHAAGTQTGTIISLGSAVRLAGGTGTILGVALYDTSDLIGAMDVVFFTETVTLAADAAAFAVSAADSLKVIEVASLNYAIDLGAQRFARMMGLGVPIKLTGTSLFASIITRSAWTPTSAAALTLTVYVARD